MICNKIPIMCNYLISNKIPIMCNYVISNKIPIMFNYVVSKLSLVTRLLRLDIVDSDKLAHVVFLDLIK